MTKKERYLAIAAKYKPEDVEAVQVHKRGRTRSDGDPGGGGIRAADKSRPKSEIIYEKEKTPKKTPSG
jgi:hypothetical protein